MAEELRKLEVNGTVVTIPTGETAYLITELPLGRKEVAVLEPPEAKIGRVLRTLGASAEDISMRIGEWIKARKVSELGKVI